MPNFHDIYSFGEQSKQIEKLVSELLEANDDLRSAGKAWAVAENDYRRAKAVAFLNLKEGTIPEKQARVDQVCERERLGAHIAEAEREACIERVKSLRAAVSAYQTLARANEVEAQLSAAPQPRW
jgi:hypothetical protein